MLPALGLVFTLIATIAFVGLTAGWEALGWFVAVYFTVACPAFVLVMLALHGGSRAEGQD